MRERMEEMNRQMQGFVDYVRTEMLSRMHQQQAPGAGLVPMRRPVIFSAKPVVKAVKVTESPSNSKAKSTGKK
jgi:MerR family transcriptional regulator/heat shock protein HspR